VTVTAGDVLGVLADAPFVAVGTGVAATGAVATGAAATGAAAGDRLPELAPALGSPPPRPPRWTPLLAEPPPLEPPLLSPFLLEPPPTDALLPELPPLDAPASPALLLGLGLPELQANEVPKRNAMKPKVRCCILPS
jgi:hypothetical protein